MAEDETHGGRPPRGGRNGAPRATARGSAGHATGRELACAGGDRPVRPVNSVPRALWSRHPELCEPCPYVALGDFPTPLVALAELCRPTTSRHAALYLKRDDLSSSVYGGNKVRTLEVLFGQAIRAGKRRVVATGAYGSNHVLATALHAPRAGLSSGAILFPQPWSAAAEENLLASLASLDHAQLIPHWAALPWAMARQVRRGHAVMRPGGATWHGCLAYVSAALELEDQVRREGLEPPAEVVLPVGSTCTTAGLLLGLTVRSRAGAWGPGGAPRVVAVRVTPWPVTSAWRIIGLAHATGRQLFQHTGDSAWLVARRELAARLEVDGSELGEGYGRPTTRGWQAIESLGELGARALDTTYSAKAMAAALRRCERSPRQGRIFWSTKSSAPLPPGGGQPVPPPAARWLAAAPSARR